MASVAFSKAFEQAARFVTHTSTSLFLTGKAGTGKTTFLRHICATTRKKWAVVAPTGVAAVTAGGVTIHSLLNLPFGVYSPVHNGFNPTPEVVDRRSLLSRMRLPASKLQLIRNLELLIVDEVSMVRADLLDMMDVALRHIRHQPDQPFGGLQMLFVGDLFQLPPVVRREEEHLLRASYASPYFFDSEVLRHHPVQTIQLQTVYRQREEEFIHVLNQIRNGSFDSEGLARLNKHYRPTHPVTEEEGVITLAVHNATADRINGRALDSLPGAESVLTAKINGLFPEHSYPAAVKLALKPGAQVMITRNDRGSKRFYNGKIGRVEKIARDGEKLWISFRGEDEWLELEREKWSQVRYQFNAAADAVEEEETGSFVQFPVRLAWAITVHKSQGLTFDRAVIDLEGAFATGQSYVALSRLRSLEGLILRNPLQGRQILADPRVVAFMNHLPGEEQTEQELQRAEADYLSRIILRAFDWRVLLSRAHTWSRTFDVQPEEPADAELKQSIVYHTLQKQSRQADKFIVELKQLLSTDAPEQLYQRLQSAQKWFEQQLDEHVAAPMLAAQREKKKPNTKQRNSFEDLNTAINTKLRDLEDACDAAAVICGKPVAPRPQAAAKAHSTVEQKASPKKTEEQKKDKTPSRDVSLQYYQMGRTVAQIAEARNLSPVTIEGHLASFIETGEVTADLFVDAPRMLAIIQAYTTTTAQTLTEFRESLGNEFSYSELRAALHYMRRSPEQYGEITLLGEGKKNKKAAPTHSPADSEG